MKTRLWFIALFIAATITTALHELEHVHNHDSGSCQVCIVDDHSVSGDIIPEIREPLEHFSDELPRFISRSCVSSAGYYVSSRAPPLS
jgi:hypothetical protein